MLSGSTIIATNWWHVLRLSCPIKVDKCAEEAYH